MSAPPAVGATGGPASGFTPSPRGPSAAEYLELGWDYPVYRVEEKKGSGTSAKRARRALSAAEAYAYIAGDDPRPLLVLRECKTCNGTDDALLSQGADNEKTFLLSRWFHCVKLPVDVRDENHPFYALFPEKDAEHLFLSLPDGSNRIGLESEKSRTKLWDAMTKVITAEYKGKPKPSLKRIRKLLDEMDMVDAQRRDLEQRRNDILEEDGPEARPLKKLNKELLETKAELAELHVEIAKASALELKRSKKARENATTGSAKEG